MTARRTRPAKRSLSALAIASLAIGCAGALAGCATTFGSPTRHAVANLQATSIDVGPNLTIDGLIVALPNATTADKGDVAYIEFNATNQAGQDDELQNASASAVAPASSPSGEPQSGSPAPSESSASTSGDALSSQPLPVGSTTIPGGTVSSPGTSRLVVALMSLTQPLSQGDEVRVSLQFANAGGVDDVLVPVWGSDYVGSSYLPSAPPSLPSSEAPSPAISGSAPASAPASAPVSGSPSAASSS